MMAGTRRSGQVRFVWRLFFAMSAVVLIGGATLLIAALLIAPDFFHKHLVMAGGPEIAELQRHVDEAFGQAMVFSLVIGMAIALTAALLVTAFVARRVADPVAGVARAATRIAAGDLEARVPEPHLGPEFDDLADSFNTMAARLAQTEATRQQLMSDLAHELRNPLASLQATLEAVEDGVLPADATTLATLSEQVGRLEHLVSDLARVSRAEAGQLDLHLADAELAHIARDACAHASARFYAAGVVLDLHVGAGPPKVRVDVDRIEEVLGNLLDNALRHSHDGDAVSVTVDRDADEAVVRVSDSGDGFEPADADRLFERFYRADVARQRDQAGSGIGLTIARAIATAHHGTLTAQSAGRGLGATFELRLPLATAQPPHADVAGDATPQALG